MQALKKIDEKFRIFWKSYIFQSAFAMFSVFLVFLFLGLQDAVVTASIGATAFIIFAMPKSITAKARNVIGGHLVGFSCGALCALIPHALFFKAIIIRI